MPTRIPCKIGLALLALLAAIARAQVPAPQSPLSAYGFTMFLPEDWQVVRTKAPEPKQQEKEEKKTSQVEEKKGIACLQVPVTARHGEPPTTIVVDVLPLACYGQKISEPDLEIFGAGAAEGLKETFDITTPIATRYELAGHDMWIERARAATRGKQAPESTLEVVCTVLSKAAVCWVARAADAAGLHTFELLPVTLDGARATALVPPDVFVSDR